MEHNQVPRFTGEARSLARTHTETAIRSLAGIAAKGESEAARVSACVALLDRGWGKVGNDDGTGDGQINVIIRHIIEGRDAPRVVDAKPLPIDKKE